jgi:hypothetical protein
MTQLPPLKTANLGQKRRLMLEDFTFMGVTIPEGFEFDGQSWFIGEDMAEHAAAVHDWLYRHNGNIPEGKFSRRKADEIFRNALIESGVSRFQAWFRWGGLRLLGWRAWNEHEQNNKAAYEETTNK